MKHTHTFEHNGKKHTIEIHENVNTGELQQLENAERARLDTVEAEKTAAKTDDKTGK